MALAEPDSAGERAGPQSAGPQSGGSGAFDNVAGGGDRTLHMQSYQGPESSTTTQELSNLTLANLPSERFNRGSSITGPSGTVRMGSGGFSSFSTPVVGPVSGGGPSLLTAGEAIKEEEALPSPGAPASPTSQHQVSPAAASSPALSAQQRAEIEECFEMLDRDGSGTIDVREIVFAFAQLGFTISKQAIEELMSEADNDGSGVLELDEFTNLMGRAIYRPDEAGKELVTTSEAGDLSFADVVRAFRRKKLIESLIQGGDARMKVVEFHEKVQELIKAETEELRQRQATHAIFERMETAKLQKLEQEREKEKLSKVEVPASQRAHKEGLSCLSAYF
ncbi:hypothetical protein GPECTOR_2g1224 [Gonium pectorale]|uniref:EF-hand domain-containing protein n=1 Tax=Gonium pectorale TaxID=33097 RepID=A0A150H0V8_GONPE|nr:hypothetical protein GPECTOR_2g1224 [Gonium pectorale]|eukprot:KXZ55674.1 hypothetical protein GPECTOR_2g1224 [Gonium pectorale]